MSSGVISGNNTIWYGFLIYNIDTKWVIAFYVIIFHSDTSWNIEESALETGHFYLSPSQYTCPGKQMVAAWSWLQHW